MSLLENRPLPTPAMNALYRNQTATGWASPRSDVANDESPNPQSASSGKASSALPIDRRLENWSRVHAVAMLVAIGIGKVVGNSKPIALSALVSFVGLIWLSRSQWTPNSNFGWANGITAFRLLIVLCCAYGLHETPGLLYASLIIGILLLDGFDGWLARRLGCASAFGAHFDMETDALLILVISQELWHRGTLGIWILTSGLLRYIYVLVAMLAPPGTSQPRSGFGRVAFSFLAIGLAFAVCFPNRFGALSATLGTILVSISFARSFYWTWTRIDLSRRGI